MANMDTMATHDVGKMTAPGAIECRLPSFQTFQDNQGRMPKYMLFKYAEQLGYEAHKLRWLDAFIKAHDPSKVTVRVHEVKRGGAVRG